MKHEKSKNDAMRHELDHIDAKILNLLRENARMPLKEIAEHVFLSSPAVSARIERLEKEGYITGYQVKFFFLNRLNLEVDERFDRISQKRRI